MRARLLLLAKLNSFDGGAYRPPSEQYSCGAWSQLGRTEPGEGWNVVVEDGTLEFGSKRNAKAS